MKLAGLLTLSEAATVCGKDKRTLRKLVASLDAQLRAAGQPGCITRFGGRTSPIYVSRKALVDAGLVPVEVQQDDRVDEIASDVRAIRERLDWLAENVGTLMALRD